MKSKAKADFERWYEEQQEQQELKGCKFDFKKELLEYCWSDVELLRKGCEEFTKQFKKEVDFNPFPPLFDEDWEQAIVQAVDQSGSGLRYVHPQNPLSTSLESHQSVLHGAKVLSFKTGPITFKDSLCFLPTLLSAFSSTFGITETKKFDRVLQRSEQQLVWKETVASTKRS